MQSKKSKKKLSLIMYISAVSIFLFESVWSLFGISPFLRIGLFAMVSVFIYAGSRIKIRHLNAEEKQRIMKWTFWVLFGLYLLLFFALVFVDSYFKNDIRAQGLGGIKDFEQYKENYTSFVPFRSTRGLLYSYSRGWIDYKAPLVNIAGNLLLCMPFAFFLPLLNKKQRNFFAFLLTVSAISLFVEAVQLATRRGFCDIDDFILNVLGACIFYGVLYIKPIRRTVQKITKLKY